MSGNACICCGRFRSHNLDPHRCVRCVNEQMVWEDARSWLPLARDRIEMLEAERDLFRGETVALAKDAMKLDAEVRALRGFAREFFGRHWNIRSIAIPEVRRLAAKHGLINNVDDAMPTELIRIGGATFTGEPGPGGEG